MLPYVWYESFTETLVAVGMAVGFIYYLITRRALRLFFYSIVFMIIGSATTLVPFMYIAYILYILGHVGVGMFIDSLIFLLIKLVHMVSEAVELRAKEVVEV
jgi:hypothetical protein